jgi:hypothetical protein
MLMFPAKITFKADKTLEQRMDVLKFVTLSSITLLLGLQSAGGFAHDTAYAPKSSNQRAIEFPDTNKYKTLAVDLHIHSVFSDGHVWPNIRGSRGSARRFRCYRHD